MSVNDGAEVPAWLDRLAILDLIHRYSDAVTRADYEQMATVFTPDTLWESPVLGLRFETPRAFIDFQIEGNDALEVLIQTPHSPVVDLVDAERATATTTIHEMIRACRDQRHLRPGGRRAQRGPVRHLLRRHRQGCRRMEVHPSPLRPGPRRAGARRRRRGEQATAGTADRDGSVTCPRAARIVVVMVAVAIALTASLGATAAAKPSSTTVLTEDQLQERAVDPGRPSRRRELLRFRWGAGGVSTSQDRWYLRWP